MANIKSDEYEIYSVGLKGLYVVARLFVNLSENGRKADGGLAAL